MGLLSDLRRAIEQGNTEADRTLASIRAQLNEVETRLALPPADSRLTKEMATDMTLRALKECFPDRWQEVWTALGKESVATELATQVTAAAIANPGAAVGAAVGAILGAAVGGSAIPVAPLGALPRIAPPPRRRRWGRRR